MSEVKIENKKKEESHSSSSSSSSMPVNTRCDSCAVAIVRQVLALQMPDMAMDKVTLHWIARLLLIQTLLWMKPILICVTLFHSQQWPIGLWFERLVALLMLEVLIPLQHIFAIHYFRKSHFEFILSAPPIGIVAHSAQCFCTYTKMLNIILLAAFVSTVVSESTSILYQEYHILFRSVAMLSTLIGRVIVGVNAILFVCTFWKHSKDLSVYVIHLKSLMETNQYNVAEEVKGIAANVVYLRYSIAKSCHALYFIFTSSTVIGGMTFAFWAHLCFQEKRLIQEDFILGSLGIFLVVHFFFLRATMSIQLCKDQVERLVFSPIFVYGTILQHGNNDTLMNSVNFLVIQSMLDAEWIHMSFAGLSIHDGKVVRPIIAAGAVFLVW